MKKISSKKKALLDKKIIQSLKISWKNCNSATLDFANSVPASSWQSKPFQFRFKSFAWEFACITRTRFCHLEAFKTGRLLFAERSSAPKKSNLEKEPKAIIIKELNKLGTSLLREIDAVDSIQKVDFITWLLQHERVHQGKLILYFATSGLKTPNSFKNTWGRSNF